MTSTSSTTNGNGKRGDPVLVVLQLSGGNDILNTVVPYGDGLYHDFRSTTGIPEDQVIHIDDHFGLHPEMGPIKDLWDQRRCRDRKRHRISRTRQIALPLNGYLAHRRASKDHLRWMAWQGHQGARSAQT